MDKNDHVINVNDDPYESLATLITKSNLSRVRPYSSSCCIYRVPTRLRRVNKIAYTPQVVSIGPIHHGKSLKIMKEHKWRLLKDFLTRTDGSLNRYLRVVKEMEEKIHGCYEETFDLSSDKFVTIILVDAVFIVEVFLTAYAEFLKLPVEHERVLNAKRVINEVSPDLLLLENQLPFFVLENIWSFATPITRMIEAFSHHFEQRGVLQLDVEDYRRIISSEKPEHFVDMVRKLYKPLHSRSTTQAEPFHPPIIDQFVDLMRKPRNLRSSKELEGFHAPAVTQLCQAGLEFRQEDTPSLFDISYSAGTLKIPKWRISDHTEVIFRNLIAFEQCHCEVNERYVCDYGILMDNLINTSMDVDLLVKQGIIENWLGDSNDVSRMINKLGKEVNISPSEFYFADIFGHLNDHCRSSWYVWKANLKQNYFNTPWAFLSVLAALFLLILTTIQTVCSIISSA